MNEAEAKAIIGMDCIGPAENSLYNLSGYLNWNPGDKNIVLDGEFSAEVLEAFAWWMKNKGK